MTESRPLGTFCWSELGTTDVAGARSFYSALFGWSYEDRPMGDSFTYHLVKNGSDELGGVYHLAGPMFEGVPPHWMFYVSVADVDATVARVPALGGKVVMPPMDIPDTGRMAMLEDPTGAKISVYQAKGRGGATGSPMTPGNFGWAELNTRDTSAAKKFYTTLFGWEAKESTGPMAYTEWTLPGCKQFGGMLEMNEGWGDAPPCWLGYVMVDDCDATFAKAASLGATPIVPPMDIDNVGRFSVIADPQGAVFAFIKLLPHP
ncbi:MAG: VOC family protein [Planctomycetota bacterium]